MTTGLPEKVLLLGSSGLLGSYLTSVLNTTSYVLKTHSRGYNSQYQAALDDPLDARQLLRSADPDVIINLVGLTNVDRCELYPNQAYLANVRTVENIVSWILQEKSSCHLIYLSTDQVYDSAGSHNENQVTLTNYYAFSKYAGELAAAKVPNTCLRTNFFGRSRCAKRTSLTDWLYQALSKNESIQVFDNVQFNPLSIDSLSQIIVSVIQKKPVGVFNLGSHGGMSKADFAFYFAEKLKLSTHTMARATTDQVAILKAYRPKDMRMDCSKFETTMDVKLPSLIDEIERAAQEYL